MKRIALQEIYRPALAALICSLFFTGCSIGQRDEVIAGVTVPIPGGMSRTTDQRMELTLPGFGGGQVVYKGRPDPDEIITFYQTEMPLRGWRPNASLVTRGGLLAYTKDGTTVLIAVSQNGGDTTLGVTVGGMK